MTKINNDVDMCKECAWNDFGVCTFKGMCNQNDNFRNSFIDSKGERNVK